MGEKKAELTHGLLRRMATGHYLACFGLVPYSFLGLFLCLNYVVHRLGHVLLYVVYYVSLKKTKKTATTNRGFSFTSRRVGTQTVKSVGQISAGRAVFRCCARTLLTAG